MKKALLVSVGGSPAPLIYSINAQKPEYLFLFVSRSSALSAREDVIPKLEHKPAIFEYIMTEDEQDLERSVAALMAEVPKKLKMWNLAYSDLAADYTGGTKTMSAAVVLALSGQIDSFSYVGGTERSKSGLGVVIDGREQMLYLKNPWNELAVNALFEIELLFNSCRYTVAEEKAQAAKAKTSSRSQLFEGLQVAAKAFALWDNFQHTKALNELKRAESHFRRIAAESDRDGIKRLSSDLTSALIILQTVCEEQNGNALVKDLVANAVRRGEIEHKYDDAVARLYSAIEKMAKLRLKSEYDIDNSDINPAQLPEAVRHELVAECSNIREGKIQLPLHKSYLLLGELGDPLGKRYQESVDELAKVLSIRNVSLLAHGFAPVTKDTYHKMLHITLGFIGIDLGVLPVFPAVSVSESL